MNLTQLASEILDRCPRCGGDRYFAVKSASVKRGFFSNKENLQVRYTCECAGIGAPGVYTINEETIVAYLEMRRARQRKMRDIFGL